MVRQERLLRSGGIKRPVRQRTRCNLYYMPTLHISGFLLCWRSRLGSKTIDS